jgi:hypothetical protein
MVTVRALLMVQTRARQRWPCEIQTHGPPTMR